MRHDNPFAAILPPPQVSPKPIHQHQVRCVTAFPQVTWHIPYESTEHWYRHAHTQWVGHLVGLIYKHPQKTYVIEACEIL